MSSFVEKIFSTQNIAKGEHGFLGAVFGAQGQMFGSAGADQGYLGASQVPKFDVKDFFNPESYFQLKDHYDPKTLWNPDDYLVDALKS